MAGCGNKICWYSLLLISGVILVIMAGLIYVISNPIISSQLGAEFIVDSEEAPRFTFFACKYAMGNDGLCEPEHDSVAFNEGYFFFNLTNLDEVNAGGVPKFEEVGPYYYQVDIEKYDIAFLEDGNIVEYNEAKTYFWRPDISCEGCDPSDQFIGINPGYIGAVDTAGSELFILLGLGGPAIGKILTDLNNTYIQALIDADGYDYWLEICQDIDPDCNSQFDMAIVQWGYYARNGNFGLRSESATNWNPSIFPVAPEYGLKIYNDSIIGYFSMEVEQAKLLLYGPKGIVAGPLYLLEMLSGIADPDYLEETWGITLLEFAAFGQYLFYLEPTYNTYIYLETTSLESGGGLFAKRTVEQWVFDMKDPLLLYMQPDDPQVAFRYNDTSVEDARSYKPGKMAMKTGKDDPKQIANITMWNGTDILPFWDSNFTIYGNVTIWGNNQDGQFFFQATDGLGKLPEVLEDFDIWSADHGKTIWLTPINQTLETNSGIPVHRYVVKNETYHVDPFYYSNVEGFVNGSFHMDPPFRKRINFSAKVPLYFSQPRMWGSNTTYSEKIILLNKEPNLEECATIVDVEPISGNALMANKRLQVNFYLDGNYNLFHPDVQMDVMYPLVYISQDITVTDALEDEWNEKLGIFLDIRYYFFIVGLAVGGVQIIIAIIGLYFASKEPKGYSSIN